MPPFVSGLLLFFGLLVLSAALGRRLLRWFAIELHGIVETAAVSAGLGLGALQALPFTLFALGLGRSELFRDAVVLLFFLLWWDVLAVLSRISQIFRKVTELAWWEQTLFGVFAVLLLSILPRSLCPVTDGDTLAYHLTCAIRLLDSGRFVYIPTLTYTNWPVATESLFALLMGIYRDAPVAVVNLVFGMVAVGATYLLARQLGGRFAGALAATLLLIYPKFWWEMASGMVDLVMAALATLAVYWLLRAKQEDSIDKSHRLLTLSAVFAGLVATTKLNGLWAMLGLSLVILLTGESTFGVRLRAAVRYAVIGFAIVLPWYIRTWFVTGNPIYPAFYRLFGGYEWTASGWDRFHTFHRLYNTPPGMEPTSSVLFWSHIAYGLAALAISVLVIWRTRKSESAIPARFAAFFFAAVTVFGYFTLRFLFAAFPSVLVCLAFALRRQQRTLAGPVCAVAAGLAVYLGVKRIEPGFGMALAFDFGRLSRSEYLRQRVPDYPIVEFVNRSLPASSRILISTEEVQTALYRRQAFQADLWRQDSIHYDSDQRLESDLKRLGITHVVRQEVWPRSAYKHLANRERLRIEYPRIAALSGRRGRLLFEIENYTLYAIDWSVAHTVETPAREARRLSHRSAHDWSR